MSGTAVVDAVERDGWAVVDLLDEAAVRAAQRVVDDTGLEPDHPFYASPAMSWGSAARAIDLRLKAIVEPLARTHLPTHRPFMAGITSKGAHSVREILFHQDWTYTDERRWRTVFLWCPLVGVDERNATLAVVPGSHRWSRRLRPSREHEVAERFQEELASRAISVSLRAGQALAFDPAAFHGSGRNATDRPRPAFTMAFAPDDAPLVHFHEDPDGTLSGFEVDEAFFTENPYRSRPIGYREIKPHEPALTESDLAAAMGIETEREERASDSRC